MAFGNRSSRPGKPLDPVRLEELALAYVARFATSAGKFEAYLRRKLRERGWDGESDPPVAALVERFVRAGYIDDAGFARGKSASLLRRGYGARRIDQALGAAGIAEAVRDEVRAGQAAQRHAALNLARKRGLGPYARSVLDRAGREKQLATLLRAGHPLDIARELMNAPDAAAAEQWAVMPGEEQ